MLATSRVLSAAEAGEAAAAAAVAEATAAGDAAADAGFESRLVALSRRASYSYKRLAVPAAAGGSATAAKRSRLQLAGRTSSEAKNSFDTLRLDSSPCLPQPACGSGPDAAEAAAPPTVAATPAASDPSPQPAEATAAAAGALSAPGSAGRLARPAAIPSFPIFDLARRGSKAEAKRDIAIPEPPSAQARKTKRTSAAPPQKKLWQSRLDCGQKSGIVEEECKSCGFVYRPCLAADVAAHARFHHWLEHPPVFRGNADDPGLRVASFEPTADGQPGGAIVRHAADDHRLRQTVDNVLRQANAELHYAHGHELEAGSTALLYIADGRVVGVATAHPIATAFRIVAGSPAQQADPGACAEKADAGADDLLQYSHTPVPATVGVSRIWVHRTHRKRQVATRLLDAVRLEWSALGASLERDGIAFSQPTTSGRRLAEAYTGRPDFLVYDNTRQ